MFAGLFGENEVCVDKNRLVNVMRGDLERGDMERVKNRGETR